MTKRQQHALRNLVRRLRADARQLFKTDKHKPLLHGKAHGLNDAANRLHELLNTICANRKGRR